MKGVIEQSVLLARPAGTKSTYTYTYSFSTSLPIFDTGYLLSGSSTTYTTVVGDFYDTSGYAANLALAASRVEQVSGVTVDPATSGPGDIAVYGINQTLYHPSYLNTAAAAFTNYPDQSLPSDIFLLSQLNTTGYAWAQLVLSHELNHAIGLLDVDASALDNSVADNSRFSIMSYVAHPGTGTLTDELQLYDIASLQALYGRSNANSGNDAYSTFTASGVNRTFSIWDSGGTDEINASGQTAGALIDLRPGHFSSIGSNTNVVTAVSSGMPLVSAEGIQNVSIAFGAYIENAVGTSHSDFIVGNALSNQLNGGDGADYLFGAGASSSHITGEGDYRQIDPSAVGYIGVVPAGIANFASSSSEQTDTIYGGAGNDYIFGSAGQDSLYGDADDDTLVGGGGADALNGGDGYDTVSYANSSAGIRIELGVGVTGGATPSATITDATGDHFSDVEVVNGSDYADYIDMGVKGTTINGGVGDDTLVGHAGDTLIGGAGADTFILSTAEFITLYEDGVMLVDPESIDENMYDIITSYRVDWITVDGDRNSTDLWSAYALPKVNIEGLESSDKIYVDGHLITGTEQYFIDDGNGGYALDTGTFSWIQTPLYGPYAPHYKTTQISPDEYLEEWRNESYYLYGESGSGEEYFAGSGTMIFDDGIRRETWENISETSTLWTKELTMTSSLTVNILGLDANTAGISAEYHYP